MTQDELQFDRAHRGSKCWAIFLCEKRYSYSLSLFSQGNLALKPQLLQSQAEMFVRLGKQLSVLHSPWNCQLDHAEFEEEMLITLVYVSV